MGAHAYLGAHIADCGYLLDEILGTPLLPPDYQVPSGHLYIYATDSLARYSATASDRPRLSVCLLVKRGLACSLYYHQPTTVATSHYAAITTSGLSVHSSRQGVLRPTRCPAGHCRLIRHTPRTRQTRDNSGHSAKHTAAILCDRCQLTLDKCNLKRDTKRFDFRDITFYRFKTSILTTRHDSSAAHVYT